MKRYGLYGHGTHDFLTYGGRILVHNNKAEMEFLFTGSHDVRELPPSIPVDQTMPIRLHPCLSTVTWPLDRRNFR